MRDDRGGAQEDDDRDEVGRCVSRPGVSEHRDRPRASHETRDEGGRPARAGDQDAAAAVDGEREAEQVVLGLAGLRVIIQAISIWTTARTAKVSSLRAPTAERQPPERPASPAASGRRTSSRTIRNGAASSGTAIRSTTVQAGTADDGDRSRRADRRSGRGRPARPAARARHRRSARAASSAARVTLAAVGGAGGHRRRSDRAARRPGGAPRRGARGRSSAHSSIGTASGDPEPAHTTPPLAGDAGILAGQAMSAPGTVRATPSLSGPGGR